MKMKLIIALMLSAAAWNIHAQMFTTENSHVVFFSEATLENITAKNKESSCVLKADDGEIAIVIPIKDFVFEKSLMQEHFNEKYMETEVYPKATFRGFLVDFNAKATGIQNVKAKGKLSIHGVTRDVEIPGTIESKEGKLRLHAKFIVVLEQYNVTRPQLLWQNIAEQVEVTTDFTLKAK